MDLGPPHFFQAVLTDFMDQGHFARHIRRMRLLYAERRTALVDGLRQEFGSSLDILGTEAGMHLVVTLPEGFRDQEVAVHAARQKIWLWPLSPTYIGQVSSQGFILGFGSTTRARMANALRQWRSALGPRQRRHGSE